MQVGICVVTYNSARHIDTCLDSCRRHAPECGVYVVDNASTDGSADLVAQLFPEATLLRQSSNLGFAAGSNVAMRAALDAGCDAVMLLNPDARLVPGTMQRLMSILAGRPQAAAVQPVVLREDGLVNTMGNPVHYLGFSMAGGNGISVADAERELPWLRADALRDAVEVPACTGAAVLLRATALSDVGLLEEELFLYHEDLELSLRLRRAGWSLLLCRSAEVVHDYAFSRNPMKWYFMERNRFWLLGAHYRAGTLALLAAPLLAAELAVWLEAARGGWTAEKLRSYRYWATPRNVAHLRRRRHELARIRRRPDRELLRTASTRLSSPDTSSGVAQRVFDGASALIWRIIYPLIRW
jgi:GT2 family glycosyltransferase